MWMIHSVVISEKPPSKRPRKQSNSNVSCTDVTYCDIIAGHIVKDNTYTNVID